MPPIIALFIFTPHSDNQAEPQPFHVKFAARCKEAAMRLAGQLLQRGEFSVHAPLDAARSTYWVSVHGD